MSDIAKKYVKALAKSLDEKQLESFFQALQPMVPAFKDKKFQAIVQSSEISKEAKSEFLLGMLSVKEPKIENFIRLLVEKGRIGLIPDIYKEIGRVIEKQTQRYHGRLISGEAVAEKEIDEISQKLSKRLGVTILLENEVKDYPGMKVEIENLGLEIGLSTDRIKQQIAQAILSAI